MLTTIENIYAVLNNWLRTGQAFTADVRDYAETVLGVCTLSELEPLVEDDENPDLEPFFEYLIFPDKRLLLSLEKVLTAPLSSTDIEHLTALLIAEHATVTLHETDLSCSFSVPDWMWESFITRLHLDDKTVPFLLSAAPCLQKTLPHTTRIYLRTAALKDSKEIRNALLLFFANTLVHDPIHADMLTTWIAAVTSLPEGGAATETVLKKQLEKRRRRLYKAIFDANEFSRKLQRFNMETLMMSGELPPAVNIDEARFEIRIIDRLSIALFQKNVGATEELEDRGWGDYVDYRRHTLFLPNTSES